jgi:hypothetical protein
MKVERVHPRPHTLKHTERANAAAFGSTAKENIGV